MSLHVLGISVDVHIDVEILLKKNGKNLYICKHSQYLSVHGVMIDLFLLFPSHLFFTK